MVSAGASPKLAAFSPRPLTDCPRRHHREESSGLPSGEESVPAPSLQGLLAPPVCGHVTPISALWSRGLLSVNLNPLCSLSEGFL